MCCSSPDVLGGDAGAAPPPTPHAQLGQDHPGKHPKSLAEMQLQHGWWQFLGGDVWANFAPLPGF